MFVACVSYDKFDLIAVFMKVLYVKVVWCDLTAVLISCSGNDSDVCMFVHMFLWQIT